MVRLTLKKTKYTINRSQLEFDFEPALEKDRNHHLGGRSFYFFDFDDNVAYLTTPIVLFHKHTGAEKLISSGEFAKHGKVIGKEGVYRDYFTQFCDQTGSFRLFRDKELSLVDRLSGKRQRFLQDIQTALSCDKFSWKAPSWNCFYHATLNQRPLSLITARGHHESTIKEGIKLLVNKGHLPQVPNYLSVFPVSNPDIRKQLGDRELKASVPELKRAAIRQSVEDALKKYGDNPNHRFGMSDDDPANIELITEEMKALKRKYPDMSFFVIQTFEDHYVKREVLQHGTKTEKPAAAEQLKLF